MLRHEVKVLRRQVKRPQLRRFDRVLLTAASQRLPRRLWPSFIVRPEILLRWHRELVRRKWTFRRKRDVGRPRLDPAPSHLIVRMARENLGGACQAHTQGKWAERAGEARLA